MCLNGLILGWMLISDEEKVKDKLDVVLMISVNSIVATQAMASFIVFGKTLKMIFIKKFKNKVGSGEENSFKIVVQYENNDIMSDKACFSGPNVSYLSAHEGNAFESSYLNKEIK